MKGEIQTKYGFDGKRLKDGEKVGCPYSPSHWCGEPKYNEVSEIFLTFGGGMGGGNWKIYAEPISFEELTNNKGFIEVNDFLTKQVIIINPKYIVSVQNFGIVTRGFVNENSNFVTGYYDLYFLTDLDAKLTFYVGIDHHLKH